MEPYVKPKEEIISDEEDSNLILAIPNPLVYNGERNIDANDNEIKNEVLHYPNDETNINICVKTEIITDDEEEEYSQILNYENDSGDDQKPFAEETLQETFLSENWRIQTGESSASESNDCRIMHKTSLQENITNSSENLDTTCQSSNQSSFSSENPCIQTGESSASKSNDCRIKHKTSLQENITNSSENLDTTCQSSNQRNPISRESRSSKCNITKNMGKKLFTCKTCKKQFASISKLKTHEITHTNRKFSCDVCGKKYTQKQNLLQHQRVHTHETPFTCNVCDKNFTVKSSLNSHLKTHTGEKPYKCQVCKKEFAEKTTLRRHKRTHTGEKPYKCNVCKKEFSLRTTLIGHSRTHSGEKPYLCHACNISFTQRGSLIKHLRTHTNEETSDE